MIVSDIAVRMRGEQWELSARVRLHGGGAEPREVWFRLPLSLGPPPLSADPFVAGFLIPCMYLGEDLKVEAPVSPALLKSSGAIQDIVHCWDAGFSRVALLCEGTREPLVREGRAETLCFYTAGIDSAYVARKRLDEIDRLIAIRGFDVHPLDEQGWEEKRRHIQAGADRIGRPLETAHTNLRDLGDLQRPGWARRAPSSFWLRRYYGSYIAAVGLCLQGRAGRFLIPAPLPYEHLIPYGSQPLVDPKWSTPDMAIEHDGCEKDRVNKTEWLLGQSADDVLEASACCRDGAGGGNCGRCEICLRFMATLRALGALERARSAPARLDLGRIRRLAIQGRMDAFWAPVATAAQARGDLALARAVEAALGKRWSPRRAWRRLGDRTRRALRTVMPRRISCWVDSRLSGWGLLGEEEGKG